MSPTRPAPFRGRHFVDDIILLCVRWCLRYSLSYEEIMAERGLTVDHVTIWRWVQHYGPLLNQGLRREIPRSWRVDVTNSKVAGIWTYLYRAVDSAGETIDFMLSPKRDLTAAKLFLALSGAGCKRPQVINVDGHPAYAHAIAELKRSGDLGHRCRCIIDYNAVLPNPGVIDLARTKAITGDVLVTWLLQGHGSLCRLQQPVSDSHTRSWRSARTSVDRRADHSLRLPALYQTKLHLQTMTGG